MRLPITPLSLFALLPLTFAQSNTTTPSNGIGSSPADRHYITLSQAQTIIDSSMANATAIGVPQNIAIVDPSGLLVAFARMDNAYPGSIDISMKKARTSVLFNGGTSASYYSAAEPGGSVYAIEETNGGLVVFGGGLPIYVDGFLIGAVGVSGGTVPQDVEVASAGVEGLGASISLR
ncbi:DUF336-domain-containing protein [Massarina eburnea CBS 473.64]|uniref:DUF336-domain-containing protein n=1 Tax=Massarina eburnea CBS 473.64 TaxID=1395130 RepID=A0A6A6S6X5_9PLEO|nr:DUF336-domain-containing protein [Massarina eburnea CBS 473.64]